jgi:hypothetical protein
MSELTERIQKAAYSRLTRKFSTEQSEILSKFIVAQAGHETGNFKSDAFKRNNNIAGYKPYSGSIWQVYPAPAGANTKYGYFTTIENSVYEVADWLGRRESAFKSVKTVADYAIALRNNNYYTDTVGNYTSGLGFYFTSLFKDAGESITGLFSGDTKKVDVVAIVLTTIVTFLATYLLRVLFKKFK